MRMLLKFCALGFGVVMLVFGGMYLKAGYRAGQKIKELQKPLFEMAIDLSEPAEYVKPLPPVERYFHGLRLEVRLATSERDEADLEQLFDGLQGTALIYEPDGEVTGTIGLEKGVCWYGVKEDRLALMRFIEPIGEYDSQESLFRLQVTRGATGLKGMQQVLALHYDFCGCEYAAKFLGYLFGGMLSAVGLVAVVLPGMSIIRQTQTSQE